MTGRYNASERKWVRELLAKLTPEERVEYERRMAAARGHPNNGKKYDGLKAQIAGDVIGEFRRIGGRAVALLLVLLSACTSTKDIERETQRERARCAATPADSSAVCRAMRGDTTP